MEDKYKSLSVPELAGEESFIRWINKGENNKHWSQWLQDNPDKRTSVSEASRIVKSLSSKNTSTLNPLDKSLLWERIHQSVSNKPVVTKQRSLSRVSWIVAAAASLALLI